MAALDTTTGRPHRGGMSSMVGPGTLRVADLPAPSRAWLIEQRYDRLVEKHEGPFSWKDEIEPGTYEVPERDGTRRTVHPPPAEFVTFDGHHVLLPIGSDHHANLQRLRVVPSVDDACLTVFMTDSTDGEGPGMGRLAFCERSPDGRWYLCTVWHEWYPPRGWERPATGK